ncbi:hypothetical protein [Halomicrococcus sp. NG-SE-24]|uniref:hypothetical protein n=1 Tax=Halomicrococcus sp. NG-SE-24 TaxID=3436928 RepID=UPI003D993991
MGKAVLGTDNRVTYTEVQAGVLGVVVGVLAGYGYALGHESVAVKVSAVFVALALGLGVTGRMSAAKRTLRREPWYALAAFLVGGTLGTLV